MAAAPLPARFEPPDERPDFGLAVAKRTVANPPKAGIQPGTIAQILSTPSVRLRTAAPSNAVTGVALGAGPEAADVSATAGVGGGRNRFPIAGFVADWDRAPGESEISGPCVLFLFLIMPENQARFFGRVHRRTDACAVPTKLFQTSAARSRTAHRRHASKARPLPTALHFSCKYQG
jgi:hypothetical protein